jgi:TonB family protein
MPALLLAFLMQATPPKEVAPVTVTGQPREAPPADAHVLIGADPGGAKKEVVLWPAGALERGVRGRVVLTCRIDVHGLAERCRVAWEAPQGYGFGAAALALRPTFKLSPREGPGGPIDADMNVEVEFRPPAGGGTVRAALTVGGDPSASATSANAAAPGAQIAGGVIRSSGAPIPMRGITMLTTPAWADAPGFEAIAAAYPPAGAGVEGYGVAHCRVDKAGVLGRCVVAKEAPAGHGFGQAAVALAPRFRVPPEAMAAAPRGAPVEVDVPVRFPPPGKEDRTVWSPAWLTEVDPQTARRYFPPEAAAKGVTHGKAVLLCKVTESGALSGCAVELASPDGLGFDRAAVAVAATLRMSLWSAEASPVKGGQVHVPIELDLGGQPAGGQGP